MGVRVGMGVKVKVGRKRVRAGGSGSGGGGGDAAGVGGRSSGRRSIRIAILATIIRQLQGGSGRRDQKKNKK